MRIEFMGARWLQKEQKWVIIVRMDDNIILFEKWFEIYEPEKTSEEESPRCGLQEIKGVGDNRERRKK